MIKLSPVYDKYYEKMIEANDKLIQKIPDMGQIPNDKTDKYKLKGKSLDYDRILEIYNKSKNEN